MRDLCVVVRQAARVTLILALSLGSIRAAIVPKRISRFDELTKLDPASRLGAIGEAPRQLPGLGPEGLAWDTFSHEAGAEWTAYLDRRSGVPLLVTGRSGGWLPPGAPAAPRAQLADLERRARGFIAEHQSLLHIAEPELVLNVDGSGEIDAGHWIVLFNRYRKGVPVENEQLVFLLSGTSLVAFGANQWGEIDEPPAPALGEARARSALDAYMLVDPGRVHTLAPAALVWIAEPPLGGPDGEGRAYRGVVGAGIYHRLVWRFTISAEGEPGTWVAKVDALTGEILAFYDDDRYGQVKGGVYPTSNDQICPDGCEQPDWPMPYADLTIGSAASTSNPMGIFACSPGGSTARTTLGGPYVRVQDQCGAVSQSVTCDADLDLGGGGGTDCDVPAGSSAGNTHASRSGFYHLNRVMEKGRAWLPGNVWLRSQLVDNVNINDLCNAYWNNVSVNFFKSGGGCRNTGEIAGVFVHEWGHGLDYNDGGGYDNPSEAYADIVAFLQTHESCVGRGFFMSGNCGGYGDACLGCTGIRDHDFDNHQSHAPATPPGFLATHCPAGSGPCGKEVHCEGYVSAEALWDLATRDLPAMGLDRPTAWQLADKLFYKSRQGSGGNAYNCALPSSDGCSAASWFTKLRAIDDDDGSLANGTPHAGAIYAAFARHGIACGAAADPSNQNHSSCPVLSTPVLSAIAASNTISLSWSAVAGAANYLVLRNDQSCDAGHTILATVLAPVTTFVDSALPNNFTLHYAVQAQGTNTACESRLSACVPATPEPTAGVVKLDRSVYNCGSVIQISVLDSNTGSSALTARIFSNREPAPETVVLTETPPGSSRFAGTIVATSGPPVHGDGSLSVANGDSITAHYTDADDGQGGANLLRQAAASTDCVAPHISAVTVSEIADTSATVSWTTDEAGDSRLQWGTQRPPQSTTTQAESVTSHQVVLTGLEPCSLYYFALETQDRGGNVAREDATGTFHHFQTLRTGGLACHRGSISFGRPLYGCSDTLDIVLADIDLDLDPGAPDTGIVTISSTSETAPELVLMTETDLDSGLFVGALPVGSGAPIPGDGILQVNDSDLITAAYHDADDGFAAGANVFQSASADCAPPAISELTVTAIDDRTATIAWMTSEDSFGWIEWGPTPALGNVEYESTGYYSTAHAVTIAPLVECDRTYFRVTSEDPFGYASTASNAGSPFQFNAYTLPGAIFRDDFETLSGWTLQGEWQIGAPHGLGGDRPDPPAAEHETKVLGVDLTGLGAHPGDYEPLQTITATSPIMDASHLPSTVLTFHQWLNADPGAAAKIEVDHDGAWEVVFNSDSYSGSYDTEWTEVAIDISKLADGNDEFQFRFSQYGGAAGSQAESGWNIDRLAVRDGSITTSAACGGCSGFPSFSGLASAVDENGCAGTGILLSWSPAAAWGTGSGGTYALYRGTTSSFVPSNANRIAQGILPADYTDASAPRGTTLYYVVRAETDEACSSGPNNGGVMDANIVRRSARDDLSQPLPGAIGGTLRLAKINDAHVRLTWSVATNAARYHVLRGGSPQGPFQVVGDVTSTLFDDLNRGGEPAIDFYLIKASDTCGNEGP